MNFLEWLKGTPLSNWVLASDYGYYICLSVHAIGMAVVTGIFMMLALRVLGVARGQAMADFERLFQVAGLGFLVNLISGLAVFSSNGPELVRNLPFLIKLTSLALGAGLGLALWRRVKANPDLYAGQGEASGGMKAVAVAVLICWTVTIVAGRIVGYTTNL